MRLQMIATGMPRPTPLEVIAAKRFTLALMVAGQERTGRPARSATAGRRILPGLRESNLQAALHGQAASARAPRFDPARDGASRITKSGRKTGNTGSGPTAFRNGHASCNAAERPSEAAPASRGEFADPFLATRRSRPSMVLTALGMRRGAWIENCPGERRRSSTCNRDQAVSATNS